jgi:hypothetical protein
VANRQWEGIRCLHFRKSTSITLGGRVRRSLSVSPANLHCVLGLDQESRTKKKVIKNKQGRNRTMASSRCSFFFFRKSSRCSWKRVSNGEKGMEAFYNKLLFGRMRREAPDGGGKVTVVVIMGHYTLSELKIVFFFSF